MVTTIAPDRLKELQDGDASFALVDTRTPESFDAWHISGAVNYPFGPDEQLETNGQLDELRELVGDADRVLTICGKGISSATLAGQLEAATDEWEVLAVDGGMRAWSSVYDHVPVDVGDGIEVVQLQRRAKGCLSYVVGCAATKAAVVVDPTDDPDAVKTAVGEVGLSIERVIDTHVHADHVSGGRRLADELEVPYHLGERATERDLAFDFEALGRNEVCSVGDISIKALETPGHTSEMIGLLVDDRAVLTADTLHADSVGRTELEFGDDAGERGARMLYETLHRTLLSLPDSVRVLPGHVTVTPEGEFAVGRPGEPITTTIGEARTGLEVLQLDEEAFVERLADPGEKPANYEEIIEINRGVRDLAPEERIELELGPNNCSA